MRQPDTIGVLGLALNACAERDGHPDGTARIEALLSAAADLWSNLPDESEELYFQSFRAMHRLLHIADIEAVTCA
jgi:hypothetical protein